MIKLVFNKIPVYEKSELTNHQVLLYHSIDNKSDLFFFRLFGSETKDKLPLGDFLCAVGQLKFRGTSVLFRLPHTCTQSLKR